MVVEPERIDAARLDIGLLDQLRPRPTRGDLGDRPSDLPLGAAVAELGVGGDHVAVVIRVS